MIAEDYFSTGDADDTAGGTAADRLNRNLSSVVSTIRDEGPAAAGHIHCLPDDSPDDADRGDTTEPGAHEIPEPFARQEETRTIPGTTVLAIAGAALLIVIAGAVYLAAGSNPDINDYVLPLAEMPTTAVAGTALPGYGDEETTTQGQAQASALFPGIPGLTIDTQVSAATGLAAYEARQQQVMDRLDVLAAAVDTLRSRLDRDQADRLANDITRETEQDMELHDLQAQLAGLQLQFAVDRAAPQPQVVVQAAKPVTPAPAPAEGDWVVNVASFSQQAPVSELQKKLAKKGIVTEIQPVSIKGKFRYRLRVTGFGSREEARGYAAKLAQDAGVSGAWAGKW